MSRRPVFARDAARFGQLCLDEGRWQGQPLIAPEWIEASVTAHASVDGTRGSLVSAATCPLASVP